MFSCRLCVVCVLIMYVFCKIMLKDVENYHIFAQYIKLPNSVFFIYN